MVLCGVIFAASGDSLSFSRSSGIIEPIARWLFPRLSDSAVHTIVVGVRKCGHVTEYGLLAALVWRALARGAGGRLTDWSWPQAARALGLVIAYAATDELHQAFVPSRESSLLDVGIDGLGGVLALGGVWLLSRFFERKAMSARHPT